MNQNGEPIKVSQEEMEKIAGGINIEDFDISNLTTTSCPSCGGSDIEVRNLVSELNGDVVYACRCRSCQRRWAILGYSKYD